MAMECENKQLIKSEGNTATK